MSRGQLKGLHGTAGLLHAVDEALLVVQRNGHIRRAVDVCYGDLAPRGILDGQIHRLAVPAHQRGQISLDLLVGDLAGADQQGLGVIVQTRIILGKAEGDWNEVHVAEFLDLIHHRGAFWNRERGHVDQMRDATREALRCPVGAAKADERVAPDLSTVRVQEGDNGAPGSHEA